MDIDSLAVTVQAARRRRWFRQVPVFALHVRTTAAEPDAVERRIGVPIPAELVRRDYRITEWTDALEISD